MTFRNLLVLSRNLVAVSCLLIMFFVARGTANAQANCTCKPNPYYELVGMEVIQKSCPTPNQSDGDYREYDIHNLVCVDGQIVKKDVHILDDLSLTPNYIQSSSSSWKMNVLRNQEGSHFIIVSKSYRGTVLGMSVPSGTTTLDDFDYYCTGDGSLPDFDSDKYPDCVDCNAKDPELNYECPADCTEELNALIEECGVQENVEWNEATCEGTCKDPCYKEKVAKCLSPENAGEWTQQIDGTCVGLCKPLNQGGVCPAK